MAEDDDSLEQRVGRLETVLGDVEAAITELATLLPKATGPTAGLPGRIADALNGIDDRLAAVERMGREQFELDQRLTLMDDTLAGLTGPMQDLAPRLKDLNELAAWLGRIEERLHTLTHRADHDDRLPTTVDRLVDSVSVLLESASEMSARLSRIEQAVDRTARPDVQLDKVLERLDALQQAEEERLSRDHTLERIVESIDRIRGVTSGKRWGRKQGPNESPRTPI